SAAAAPAGSISDAPAAASPGDENVALAPESSRAGAPRVPARSRPAAPRQPAGTPAEPEGVSQAGSAHVVAVNSNVADAYQALEQGRLNDAERLYRLALASDGRNLDAMLGLASALSQQGQGAAASQLYLRALEQDPQNTYAQAGLLNVAGQADP